jgi:hypothetical protein
MTRLAKIGDCSITHVAVASDHRQHDIPATGGGTMSRLVLVSLLAVVVGCKKSAPTDSADTPGGGGPQGGGPARELVAQQAQEKALKHLETLGAKVNIRKTSEPGDPPMDVDLSGKTLTEADMKELGALKDMTRLNLRGATFPAAGLKELASLRGITAIDLSDCKAATDDAVKDVSTLQSLTTLSLAGTPITDAAVKHLAALPLLTSLDLTGTKATEVAVSELQQARPRCKVKK